jgi:hypothetical protein
MLQWTRDHDGFRSDGYVIRSAAPFRWVLSNEAPSAMTPVHVVVEPLATARTLGEAKRAAELHSAATHRTEVIRRGVSTLILSMCGMVFAATAPVPWNFFLTFGLITLALRSVAFLLGLALSRWSASFDDFFYQ